MNNILNHNRAKLDRFGLVLVIKINNNSVVFTVSPQNLSTSSPAKETDEDHGKSLAEEMKEDIKEIKNLVQQKRFRKNRKMVLKLLDDLSAKAELCGGR